jgi:hypothetical protein
VGKPDLSISEGDISFTPKNPQLNDKIIISARLYNNGTFDSPEFQVVLEELNTMEISAMEMTMDPIEKDSYGIVNFNINLTVFGVYEFRVSLDPNNELRDANEENNIATRELDLRPDILIEEVLIVDSPDSSDNLTSLTTGGEAYIKVVLKNPGGVDIVIPFKVKIHDPTSRAEIVYATRLIEDVIGAGDSEEYLIKLDLDSAESGKHTIRIEVDSEYIITESNEDNNRVSIMVMVEDGGKGEGLASFSSTDKLYILLGAGVILIILVIIVRWRKGKTDPSPEEVYEPIIVEALAVEPIEDEEVEITEEKKTTPKKKRKRSIQELVSKLEKTIDEEGAEKGKEANDGLNIPKEVGKGDIDLEFADLLDLDDTSEEVESQEDFIDTLRGEMRNMKL